MFVDVYFRGVAGRPLSQLSTPIAVTYVTLLLSPIQPQSFPCLPCSPHWMYADILPESLPLGLGQRSQRSVAILTSPFTWTLITSARRSRRLSSALIRFFEAAAVQNFFNKSVARAQKSEVSIRFAISREHGAYLFINTCCKYLLRQNSPSPQTRMK